MSIRPLKQKLGSKNCVAVVAAMATGCLPEDFENRFGNKGIYSDMDFFIWLWEIGFGLVMGFSEINGFNPHKQRLHLDIDLEDYMAYVAVDSEDSNQTHAILWDSKQLYDPNPKVPHGLPWSKYNVLQIYPFTKKPIEEPEEIMDMEEEYVSEE